MARSVLIIDNDEPSVKLARTVLEAEGWRVVHAAGSEQAHAMLKSFRPSLVITALVPPRDAALAALRQTAALAGDVPIVVVTALDGPETEYQARAAGCAGYMSKPIDISTFSAQLRSYLGAHQ